MERQQTPDPATFGGGSGEFAAAAAVASPVRSSGNRRRAFAVLGGVAALFGLFGWMKYHGEHHLHVAEVPVRALASVLGPRLNPEEEFPERFPMQVAVLRTAADQSVLPVAHALREMGIPFFVTRDVPQALRHRLVVLYPHVDARTFSAADLDRIRGHVEAGGSIFAQEAGAGPPESHVAADSIEVGGHVEAGGSIFAQEAGAGPPESLLGFRGVAPSKRRHVVRFQAGADPVLRYLDRPEELEIRLGSDRYPEIFWTQGYSPEPGADVLARYEDGSAALLRKRIGRGA